MGQLSLICTKGVDIKGIDWKGKSFSGRNGRQDEKLVVKYLTLNRVKYCRNAFRALLKIYDGVFLQNQQLSAFRKTPSDICQGSKYASRLNSFRLNTILEVNYTEQKMRFSTKDFVSKCDQIGSRCGHIYRRNIINSLNEPVNWFS